MISRLFRYIYYGILTLEIQRQIISNQPTIKAAEMSNASFPSVSQDVEGPSSFQAICKDVAEDEGSEDIGKRLSKDIGKRLSRLIWKRDVLVALGT